MDKIISVKDIVFTYGEEGDAPVLDHLSTDIERGSFVAVVGPNGSGKSTFAKHLNALLVPDSGTVEVDGIDTKDDARLWDIRTRVGMVFQNPDNQLVSSVVEDDVAFGPENLGVDPLEIRRRVDDSLNAVGMYEHRKKGPHLLSGGQKQRVAIAGVLAMEPDCLVFDEPTAMLDPAGRREILNIICRLHQSGKTIVLITHYMEEAAKADRILVLKDGRLVMDDTPRGLFSRADELTDMNLELPFAVDLAERLRKAGFDLPEGITEQQQLAEALCALK